MAEFTVRHVTAYRYAENVTRAYNQAVISPQSRSGQEVLEHSFKVLPEPDDLRTRSDYFGNQVCYFSVEKPHKELIVEAFTRVSTPAFTTVPLQQATSIGTLTGPANVDHGDHEWFEYCVPSKYAPVVDTGALSNDIKAIFQSNQPVLQAAWQLCRLIYEKFEYNPRATNIHTPVSQVLKKRKGVCQDFAHLMISLFRSFKLPARYISGFIETYSSQSDQKMIGADATHAWISVYCPQMGWVDFDPTNGKMRDEGYIETAIGRDFADVSPVKGVIFGGGKNKLQVGVTVTRVT